MSIPIDESTYHILKSIGPDDDIDFEALGIDTEALQAAIQESIQATIQEKLQQTTYALDNVDYFNPFLLGFYASLLIMAFLVIRLKSIIFSSIITIFSLLFVIFDEEIGFILSEYHEQLGFEVNPFTFDNIFMNFSISLPVFGLLVFSFAALLWQIGRSCCCAPKKKTKKD